MLTKQYRRAARRLHEVASLRVHSNIAARPVVSKLWVAATGDAAIYSPLPSGKHGLAKGGQQLRGRRTKGGESLSENYANDAGRDKVEFQLIFAIEGEADNRNDGSCSDVVVTLDFDGQ
ncbi:hypothetical protein ASE36_20775 [Rhizobium sp. Root274]|nr:hypothetical protein ASC71_20825 [Rhizobium sp. Root1240]KRD26386.1 hypothetical protein ASE36_20775 [Rhizobium sp. Root274]